MRAPSVMELMKYTHMLDQDDFNTFYRLIVHEAEARTEGLRQYHELGNWRVL